MTPSPVRFAASRILLVSSLAVLSACTTSVYKDVYPTLTDGRYDSEFPYKGCSQQLEEVSGTVHMLSSIAYYRSYAFTVDERITRSRLTEDLLSRKRDKSVYVNSTASGTATTVYYENRRIAVLTCAHVVDFEDTVLAYHIDENRRATPFLKNVAVKEKQSNYVAVFPEGGEMEILAMDRTSDIALLGHTFFLEPSIPLPVFRYPWGKARELEWGTFVYLFGFPSGYKMVTKGIVSSPNKDRRGTFMVDAMFSRGFSGGIALAIRDGVPNFELVGMIKLVSAHTSYLLAPEKENGDVVFDPAVPYNGQIYVERRTEIESGITQAVSVESIREFIRVHGPKLQSRGYALTGFLNPE